MSAFAFGSPRAVHLAEQADALDRDASHAFHAHIADGGLFDEFDCGDRRHLEALKQYFGETAKATCSCALGSLTPLWWTPRAPAAMVCHPCFVGQSHPDQCDDCGVFGTAGWRETVLPRGFFEIGFAVTPPVHIYLRLCDECLSVQPPFEDGVK